MKVNFLDFNDWMISSSYTESKVIWQNTPIFSGEGENLIIQNHLNTILEIQTPSGSKYGDTHFELINITDEVLEAYSSSL